MTATQQTRDVGTTLDTRWILVATSATTIQRLSDDKIPTSIQRRFPTLGRRRIQVGHVFFFIRTI